MSLKPKSIQLVRDGIRAGFLVLIAALELTPVAAADRPVTSSASTGEQAAVQYTEQLLSARVNGVDFTRPVFMLQTAEGNLLVPKEVISNWGLVVPGDRVPINHQGQDYYSLADFPDLSYSIDEASQAVIVEAGARHFNTSTIEGRPDAFRMPQQSPAGGFFNYDLFVEHTDTGGNIGTGALELGFFNDWGVGTTTLLARGLDAEDDVVRLNTTWRYDWPGKVRTLRLGDTFSRTGAWSRGVQYGGIQWGTNFNTQPGFITFPLPDLSGETTLPGSVELYANDQRRINREVQPGPFSISNVPVLTGANELQLVVRDVLGREQVITRSFYASQNLLKDGLHDYTYETGLIRENFSIRSNDYGRAFVSGTHRLGISDWFTGEVRAEVLADHQTAGLSASVLTTPWLGILSASVAGSTGDRGEGALVSIGLDRQGRRFNYGIETTWTSEDFRQLGLQPDEPAPRQSTLARLSMRLPANSSINLNYLKLDRREFGETSVVNAGYSMGVSDNGFLNAFVSHDLDSDDTSISLTFSFTLGERTNASVSHLRDEDGHRNQVRVQRNLPRGEGFGYRLLAEDASAASNRHRAEVAARTSHGTYRAEAARFGSDMGYRLGASGGAALLGGNMFLSRRVDDSFGVVEVGDYEGVRVYHENQVIGRTNSNGATFIPDMRSFDENRIRFEQSDLPLDAQIGNVASIAIPAFRRGALVKFEAKSAHGALITLRQASGEPLPAGATVHIVGSDERFPVARRGEVWVTGLERENQLEAIWQGQRCRFQISLPEDPGPLLRIGPIVCKEGEQ